MVTNTALLWLMAAVTVCALPHFIYQPVWVSALFGLMMGWRLMHHLRSWTLPSQKRSLRWLHSLAAVLTIALLFANYGLSIGRDAGAALLTVMLAFKVVEINNRRDFYLVVFLGYFLATTNFFFTQHMLVLLLMFVAVVMLTAALIQINSPVLPHKVRLKLAGIMVLQAVPVMLVLFVLFPRIPGPIWGLPSDAASGTEQLPDGMTLGRSSNRSGTPGMSDSLFMGRISDVIQSDAIAFRVAFDNDRYPPNAALYWRGPVLWKTDGVAWRPLDKDIVQQFDPVLSVSGDPFQYTMTLEPHNRRWLFALDMPIDKQSDIVTRYAADGLLTSKEKIRNRTQIQLTSHSLYQFNAEQDPLLKAALQLPEKQHPRTRQLAKELRQQSVDDADYVQKVLAYFNEQAFFYTLNPPILRGDSVDQFLFESREGFCEHYAASFTVLMRAGGVPARIVTGYQGGEVNPVDDVMVVRQRNAHAWAEVWLPSQGWVRADPTAAVAPDRIAQGILNLLPENRRSPAILGGNLQLEKAWQAIKDNWNALNNSWDIWVVGYGPVLQKAVLSMFGMQQPDWRKMAFWLISLMVVLFTLIALLMHWQKPINDPLQRFYQKFCKKLLKLDIERPPYEGPQDFAARAAQKLPAYRAEITQISTLYRQARYGRHSPARVQRFIMLVKAFKPRH